MSDREEIIHEYEINLHENNCKPMTVKELTHVRNFLDYAIDSGMIFVNDQEEEE